MSLKAEAEPNKIEQTGSTIARSNARVLGPDELKEVSGGEPTCLPSKATTCKSIPTQGGNGDYDGFDC